MTTTRRTFNAQMLSSLMAYGLIETLFHRNLLADEIKPVINKWLTDLAELGRDVNNADHYLVKPTIDRVFKPGECSTVSDHKDNVHWFKAQSEAAFIFNIHITGYNPENKKPTGRIYVDPDGEKTAGGLIVAKK